MPEEFKTTPDTPENNENLILHRRTISDLTFKNGKQKYEEKVENLIENGVLPMESPKDKVFGMDMDAKTHLSANNENDNYSEQDRQEMHFKVRVLPEFQSEQWEQREERIWSDTENPADILSFIALNNGTATVEGRDSSEMQSDNDQTGYSEKTGFQSDRTIDRPIVVIRNYKIVPSGEMEESGDLEYIVTYETPVLNVAQFQEELAKDLELKT